MGHHRPWHQTISADIVQPSAPSLSATPGTQTVYLSWSPATDNVGVTKYEVWMDDSYVTTLAETARSYTVTGLTAGVSHSFRVVAYDAAGNYANSNTESAAALAPVGDITSPTAAWRTPAEGATVSGFLFEAGNSGPSGPCEISASDDVGVTKVLFYVDGILLNQENYEPWSCKLDTTTVSNGSHTLKAVAYDAAGNTTTISRTVTVDNSLSSSQLPPPPGPLVFDDEFDGLSLDTSKWFVYTTPGNHADEPGIRAASAWSVANGLLTCTATNQSDGQIVTGGMSMRNTDLQGGRWQARVRTDPDPTGSLSGVVILWPTGSSRRSDGEIDFYETGTSTNRFPFYSYIHYGAASGDFQTQFTHQADASQWHEMTIDWLPAQPAINIYRDGVLVWSVTDPAKMPIGDEHMTVQLDAFARRTLPGPLKMQVDWVRVYH